VQRVLQVAIGGLLFAALSSCGRAPDPAGAAVLGQDKVHVALGLESAGSVAKGDAVATEKSAGLESGTSFAFPQDSGGALLLKLLQPNEKAPQETLSGRGPIERRVPSAIDQPASPFPAARIPPVLLPRAQPGNLRPHPVREAIPLNLAHTDTGVPARVQLPVSALVRIDAPDSSQPLPLSSLAVQSADRASLEDPSSEQSARNVIGGSLPLRTTPAAFLKANLPDPFEHFETIRLRVPIIEDANRSLSSPPAPQRELK
jgi:hypothetical protein